MRALFDRARGIRRRAVWPLLLTGLLGVSLTALFFGQIRAARLASFRLRFQEDAAPRSALIMHRVQAGVLVTKALGSFLEDAADLDIGRFEAFASPLAEQQEALQAMEWIPRVPA